MVEAVAPLADLGDIHRADAEQLLRKPEIGARLLVRGIDLQQDDVLGILLAHDRLAEQPVVARIEQGVESWIDAVGFSVALGHHRLVAVERREALDLDELGFQVGAEPEIGLHEHRYRRFVGHAVSFGDGGARLLPVLRIGDQLLHHLPAIPGHSGDQVRRQETRCLAMPELRRLPGAVLEQLEEAGVARPPSSSG